jgi:hypothetical protein
MFVVAGCVAGACLLHHAKRPHAHFPGSFDVVMMDGPHPVEIAQ